MHRRSIKGIRSIRYTRSEKRSISVLVILLLLVNLGTLVIKRTEAQGAQENHDAEPDQRAPVVQAQLVLLELNTADSLSLLDLYGIGPVFSHRILRYRDLLGGYYDKQQLMEVYGMDEERFSGFSDDVRVDTTALRKINLRTVGFKEMLRHPYITYEMVKAYIRFRDRSGPPETIREAIEGALWPDSTITRLIPYLSLESNDE